MLLITEFTEALQFVTEDKGGKKHLYVEGPYISVDLKNRNGRIYPRGIMEPIVEAFVKEKIDSSGAYGEFGHPKGPEINHERISHRIVSLKWDGPNNAVGKSVILDQGLGLIIHSIIESGGRLGMSTRGLGSVKNNSSGIQEVQNDFRLVTVDAVTDPSGQGCFVNGIMEGVQYHWDNEKNAIFAEKVTDVSKKLHTKSLREIEELKLRVFEWAVRESITHK